MNNLIKRELKVAFSKNVQPMWLRISKWIVLVGGAVMLYRTRFFWLWILVLAILGIAVHLLYRWRTEVWTKPWGGWNDLDAGK